MDQRVPLRHLSLCRGLSPSTLLSHPSPCVSLSPHSPPILPAQGLFSGVSDVFRHYMFIPLDYCRPHTQTCPHFSHPKTHIIEATFPPAAMPLSFPDMEWRLKEVSLPALSPICHCPSFQPDWISFSSSLHRSLPVDAKGCRAVVRTSPSPHLAYLFEVSGQWLLSPPRTPCS